LTDPGCSFVAAPDRSTTRKKIDTPDPERLRGYGLPVVE
jgi:hypothetical protein